jgi:hypothetical protein
MMVMMLVGWEVVVGEDEGWRRRMRRRRWIGRKG